MPPAATKTAKGLSSLVWRG